MTPAVTRSLARVASVAAVGVLAGALALLAAPVGASAGTTERVSVAISADGRFVAFSSAATNLVAGDTNWAKDMYGFDNPAADVFVHDRVTRTTERVSVDSFANQADGGHSSNPAISANGRFVAFESVASNLVPGDTNGANDVFVHDRRSPDRGDHGTGAE
ncbi:MAG: hypothetical protein DMD89_06350 [Candidatus Rokuibacteriota bacterium]|nr:MAG: hypothetical protein DMD89_06350 [Candidatus Rokubacteria bacterium]